MVSKSGLIDLALFVPTLFIRGEIDLRFSSTFAGEATPERPLPPWLFQAISPAHTTINLLGPSILSVPLPSLFHRPYQPMLPPSR